MQCPEKGLQRYSRGVLVCSPFFGQEVMPGLRAWTYLCQMQDSTVASRTLTWQDTAYFKASGPPVPVFATESLFTGHLLRVADAEMAPAPRVVTGGWTFPVIIGLMTVVLVTNMKSGVGPLRVLRAAVDGAMLSTLVRLGTTSDQRVPAALFLSGVVSIGMFGCAAAERLVGSAAFSLEGMAGMAAMVLLYLLGTRWLNLALAGMVGCIQLARSYGVIQGVLVTSLGIALLPVTLALLHGPDSWRWLPLLLGALLVLWFLISDALRSTALLWSDTATRAHHIIYYFCAFKILPLSVVIRAFIGN